MWKYLDGHPKIAARGEMFLATHDGAHTYAAFLSHNVKRRFVHYLSRSSSIDAYLSQFFSSLGDVDAAGFKLMYNQIDASLANWLFRHEVRIIHLIRRNIFKTILSREAKSVRGIAHATDDQAVQDVRLTLNVRRLLRNISKLERLIGLHAQRYSRLPYLEVSYEDFVGDPETTSRSIFRFLGVPPVGDLKMPLKKINPDSPEMLISNFPAVCKALSKHGYSMFLE